MSDDFPTNDMNDPNDPNTPNHPYGVSRALPTPTTPAGFSAGQPSYGDEQSTLPPTGYPPSPYGAPMMAGGAGTGGPQGPGGAGRPSRGWDWRGWGLIGVVVLVGLLVLGGGAVLAGVALAHGTATTHTTTTPTAIATPAPTHQLPVYAVTSVSATTIDATNASGSAVVITLSAKTVYVRADQPASLSDIASGTRIRVLGHQKTDGSIIARRIMIVVPTAHGKVTAINGNSITIQTAKGTVNVTINATTKFGKGQTFGVIHVGDVVLVAGVRNSDGSYTALAILDRTAAMNASGSSATATPAA